MVELEDQAVTNAEVFHNMGIHIDIHTNDVKNADIDMDIASFSDEEGNTNIYSKQRGHQTVKSMNILVTFVVDRIIQSRLIDSTGVG